jgi:glycosyltransferase involved in cell wall biosynthesis
MNISIIVPVRDEQRTIRGLLENLLAQSRTPDEIVITDGGSTDSTRSIIAEYIANGAAIRLIEADDALPGRGRNLAASAARFEWLAFIDAGVVPNRDWLELLAAKAEGDKSIDVVFGSWTPITDSFFKECAAIAYVPPAIVSDGFYVRPRFIASAMMRRAVWHAVGGFPEHLRSGEDLVFMKRVEEQSYRTVFEPRAMVHWEIKPSFSATFSRFVTYSRNNIRAGLWRNWQSRIITRYSVIVLLGLPSFVFGLSVLLLPLIIWIGMLMTRAVVSLRRNRFCYPATIGRNVGRMFLLTPLIAVIDAAAIAGTIQWLFKDSFRHSQRSVEAGDGA